MKEQIGSKALTIAIEELRKMCRDEQIQYCMFIRETSKDTLDCYASQDTIIIAGTRILREAR